MDNLNIHYVYAHKNPKTKEIFYIGVGYKNRCFKFLSGRNKDYIKYIKKNGKPIVDILYNNISRENACDLETKLISEYGRIGFEPNGILVNKSLGGKHSNYGNSHTEETKLKISQNTKGKKRHSEEQKEKWSKERKDRKVNWDPNHVKADKGRPKPEGFGKCRYRKVLQFSLDNIFLKEWNSFKDILNELGIGNTPIWSNIKGHTKQCGGFIWKYKE
jgi:hypothetical protein